MPFLDVKTGTVRTGVAVLREIGVAGSVQAAPAQSTATDKSDRGRVILRNERRPVPLRSREMLPKSDARRRDDVSEITDRTEKRMCGSAAPHDTENSAPQGAQKREGEGTAAFDSGRQALRKGCRQRPRSGKRL